MVTFVAQIALEYWRASGPRNVDRLADLVRHFAETNGQTSDLDHHIKSAMGATRSWEMENR